MADDVLFLTPDRPPRRMSGYAMSVLRKEADRRWRMARDANLVRPEEAGPRGGGSDDR